MHALSKSVKCIYVIHFTKQSITYNYHEFYFVGQPTDLCSEWSFWLLEIDLKRKFESSLACADYADVLGSISFPRCI